jgi:hypothetical protein
VKCPSCGNSLGLFARLKTHSDTVCNHCKEKATDRLKALVQTVATNQTWKQQYADGWITQFEGTVHKYGIEDVEADALRSSLLAGIFGIVEVEDHITERDLKFLLDLAQRYGLAQSRKPEIIGSMQRIVLRKTIQDWQKGDIPKTNCSCTVPRNGEVCHWEEPAGLLIERKKREYVGGYGSVSIPVPLLHGVRARVGGFRGVPVDHTLHEDGGRGILHITSERILFAGQEQSVAVPYDKIVGTAFYSNGFELHTTSAKKPGIFLIANSDLTKELITLASSGRDRGASSK